MDACDALRAIGSMMSEEEAATASACDGWTRGDVLRHVRGCVQAWNERLDAEESGALPRIVVDTPRLSPEQLEQIEQLRAGGLVVHDMSELSQATIDELRPVRLDQLARDFDADARRYVDRVRDREATDVAHEAVELHLHAHDLDATHRPADVDLVADIWRRYDPDLTGPDLWAAVVSASGR